MAFFKVGVPLLLSARGCIKEIALWLYHDSATAFPLQVCSVCGEEFELRPKKPGFPIRCPAWSEPEHTAPVTKQIIDADERRSPQLP